MRGACSKGLSPAGCQRGKRQAKDGCTNLVLTALVLHGHGNARRDVRQPYRRLGFVDVLQEYVMSVGAEYMGERAHLSACTSRTHDLNPNVF